VKNSKRTFAKLFVFLAIFGSLVGLTEWFVGLRGDPHVPEDWNEVQNVDTIYYFVDDEKGKSVEVSMSKGLYAGVEFEYIWENQVNNLGNLTFDYYINEDRFFEKLEVHILYSKGIEVYDAVVAFEKGDLSFQNWSTLTISNIDTMGEEELEGKTEIFIEKVLFRLAYYTDIDVKFYVHDMNYAEEGLGDE